MTNFQAKLETPTPSSSLPPTMQVRVPVIPANGLCGQNSQTHCPVAKQPSKAAVEILLFHKACWGLCPHP